MTRTRNLSLAALVATALISSATMAADNDDPMAARHAEYEAKTKARRLVQNRLMWRLRSNNTRFGRTFNRVTRYSLKLISGEINPTNVAMFGEDFAARSAEMLDRQLQLTEAHQHATGEGVVVAVLDSGFNLNHPEVAGNLLPYGYDAIDDDFNPHDVGNAQDDDGDGHSDLGVGHGTFVCGMIARAAPGVRLLPIRTADDEGYGGEDEVVRGIQYAVDMGVDVMNISFESGMVSARILWELRQADLAGILVVVSAGNDGQDEMKDMADQEYTLCVGAVDYEDRLAGFSNCAGEGQTLDLVAPGVDLVGPHGGGTDDSNCVWSGTSFAAPLAAGAAALLIEREPHLMTADMRRALTESVDMALGRDGEPMEGTGRLNLLKVVTR